ncbi:hypothetical protein GS461_07880 [Rhodococcus hoagii]|nr:hypothetical protein [Prescottella equi]NKS66131.1 hypothetical protein [Prescottella equi]
MAASRHVWLTWTREIHLELQLAIGFAKTPTVGGNVAPLGGTNCFVDGPAAQGPGNWRLLLVDLQ